MPRLLAALKSMIARPAPTAAVAEAPKSLPSALLSTARDVAARLSPTVERTLREFAQDKSSSELIFLVSILLAVFLFVVVLPACEYISGERAGIGEDGTVEKDYAPPRSPVRVYRPGVGVVTVDVGDIAELSSSSGRGSAGAGGNFSCGSVGSRGSHGSLETIEESEEEDLEEEEEEEEAEQDAAVGPAPAVHRSKSDSALSQSFTSQGSREEEIKESVAEQVKYYEFLSFLNSDSIDRALTIRENGEEEKKEDDDGRASPARPSSRGKTFQGGQSRKTAKSKQGGKTVSSRW